MHRGSSHPFILSQASHLSTVGILSQIVPCRGAFTHEMPGEPLQLGQPSCLQTMPST